MFDSPNPFDEKPSKGLTVPWVLIGIGCGCLVASLIASSGKQQIARDYSLAEIESAKTEIETLNVRIGPHVSIQQGGIYNAKDQIALDNGTIDQTLYPIYSQELYEQAMGKEGELPPSVKQMRKALKSNRIAVLTNKYKHVDDVPIEAQKEESIAGEVVKRPGESLAKIGLFDSQVNLDDFKDIYIIEEKTVPTADIAKGVNQMARIPFFTGIVLIGLGVVFFILGTMNIV